MKHKFEVIDRIINLNYALLERQERMGFKVQSKPTTALCLERDGVKHKYIFDSNKLLVRCL